MNIVNALVDNVFKHRLTSMNNVQSVILTSYTYNTIIEFRYDDTEFKRLLIDSEAITKSTEEIDQLKALQRMKDVELNTSTTESITFIFEIDSIAFIETTLLNTPMRLITFHIVSINTSFLLCLIDMNKLEAFFNNIINEIIQNTQKHSIMRRYEHVFLL
jgi:hypothetical protein